MDTTLPTKPQHSFEPIPKITKEVEFFEEEHGMSRKTTVGGMLDLRYTLELTRLQTCGMHAIENAKSAIRDEMDTRIYGPVAERARHLLILFNYVMCMRKPDPDEVREIRQGLEAIAQLAPDPTKDRPIDAL
jgi:hypothetical protein